MIPSSPSHGCPRSIPGWPETAGVDGLSDLIEQLWVGAEAVVQPGQETSVLAVSPSRLLQKVQPAEGIAVEDANQHVIAQEIGNGRARLIVQFACVSHVALI